MKNNKSKKSPCDICATNPNSHSFKRIPPPKSQNNSDSENIKYFYSCPAKASKYEDHDGIIKHVDNMLSHINGDPWIWMFDSTGFGVKHYLEIRTAQSLAKLISDKYSNSLRQIIVLNPSWHMRLTINVVWPFLSDKIRQSILLR